MTEREIILLAGMIAFILLNAVLVWVNWRLQKERETLANDRNEQELSRNWYQSHYYEARDNLWDTGESLANITARFATIYMQRDAAWSTIKQLRGENTKLVHQLGELTAERNELQTQCENLQGELGELYAQDALSESGLKKQELCADINCNNPAKESEVVCAYHMYRFIPVRER